MKLILYKIINYIFIHNSQFIRSLSSNKLRAVYEYIILCKIIKLIIYYYILIIKLMLYEIINHIFIHNSQFIRSLSSNKLRVVYEYIIL
jgi:hypothetical protein